tara:strand:- start:258 stop:551 length:294 start_codon:yes stop_codon:yes gene_type:complete
MAHVNFLTVRYTAYLIVVGCLLFSGQLTNLFQTESGAYFLWLFLLTIAELITLAIFIIYYQEISNKKGKPGKRGARGDRGMTGTHATCAKCKELGGN